MFALEESLVDDCCWEDWFLVSIIAILYTSGLRIETTIFFNVYFTDSYFIFTNKVKDNPTYVSIVHNICPFLLCVRRKRFPFEQ